jgi:nucleoid DNA-binding protein
VDWKNDLQTYEENRKSRKPPTPVVGKKPYGKSQFNVVQMTFDAITQTLAKNDRVELRDFGVFEAVVRKARVGRNPNNPEIDVPIPRRAVVKFKAGKTMRESVLKLPAKQQQKKTT